MTSRLGAVKLIQTHISWVFITDRFAYKVKKPVDLGFLNFTTLRRRHHYLHEELILNRRLCPEIYLEVLPITAAPGPGAPGRPGPSPGIRPEDGAPAPGAHDGRSGGPGGACARSTWTASSSGWCLFTPRRPPAPGSTSSGSRPSSPITTKRTSPQTEDLVGQLFSRELFEHIRNFARSFLSRTPGPVLQAHPGGPHPGLPRRPAHEEHLPGRPGIYL